MALILAALGLLAAPARAEDADRAGAGMQVHIDPQTGQLLPEPATPTPPPSGALTTGPAQPAPDVVAPGGGMMTKLNGRFMSDTVATVEPDGSVRIDCIQRVPR